METIYWCTLRVQVALALLLFFGTLVGALGFRGTVTVLFCFMCTIGISYPNAAALSLAPFTKNIGSASAMLGFLQMAVGAFASSLVGFFDTSRSLPIMAVFAFGASAGLIVYVAGRRRIPLVIEHAEAPAIIH
jgi:DHA1 family bicyclomycin/chloramphenicol resistance-like MFS transporter